MGDLQGDPDASELQARCAPIELLIADVDGVLTDVIGLVPADFEFENENG